MAASISSARTVFQRLLSPCHPSLPAYTTSGMLSSRKVLKKLPSSNIPSIAWPVGIIHDVGKSFLFNTFIR